MRARQVQHNADWQPGTEEEGKHIAHFIDKPVLTAFGREIPKSGEFFVCVCGGGGGEGT